MARKEEKEKQQQVAQTTERVTKLNILPLFLRLHLQLTSLCKFPCN